MVSRNNVAPLIKYCSHTEIVNGNPKGYVLLDVGSGSTKVKLSFGGHDCGSFTFPNGHQQCLNSNGGVFEEECREDSIKKTTERLDLLNIDCKHPNHSCVAVATAWARTANQSSIAQYEIEFENRTGIDFKVINQQTEGLLGYFAVKDYFEKDKGVPFTGSAFDIGGGSFQVISPDENNQLKILFGGIGSEGMLKELQESLGLAKTDSIPLDKKDEIMQNSYNIVRGHLELAGYNYDKQFGHVIGVGPFLNAGIRDILQKNIFTIEDIDNFLDRCFAGECKDLNIFLDRSPAAFLHVIPTNFIIVKQIMNILGIDVIELVSRSILDGFSYFDQHCDEQCHTIGE